jgi:hypothetical protein
VATTEPARHQRNLALPQAGIESAANHTIKNIKTIVLNPPYLNINLWSQRAIAQPDRKAQKNATIQEVAINK